jgi:hypothetical protein
MTLGFFPMAFPLSLARSPVPAMLRTSIAFVALLASTIPSRTDAGGGWVNQPGQAGLTFGFSRKTADEAWNPEGVVRSNLTKHDFRYVYVNGEVGIVNRLSALFLVTYLHGIEGEEVNIGLSDAWLTAKYAVARGEWPMAVAFQMRTAYLYDLEGPYDRHLYMEGDGDPPPAEFRGVSPEWRGILKEDYTLAYAVSRNIMRRGWATLETGYTWRVGAPADQWPIYAEAGIPVNLWSSWIKGTSYFVKSLNNDTAREPDDRFGASANNNFNDASMWRLGASALVPIPGSGVQLEAGYNHWVWGRSARIYHEPFFSLNYYTN